MTEHKQSWKSPLGDMLLSANDVALTGVWFIDQKYAPDAADFQHTCATCSVLENSKQWLSEYFESFEKNRTDKHKTPTSELPKLAPKGTEFQQQVWQELLLIPSGDTPTYGQLAQSMGKPAAVRAVAAAIGRNPISVIIPCHRVIGANGSLTGYAGGLDRKQALLAHEQLVVQQCLPV